VIGSSQGPALGSAIHAAVAAGEYPDIPAAAGAMGSLQRAAFTPDPDRAEAYTALYNEYLELHDYFGRGSNEVMRRLKAIRRSARAASPASTTQAVPA
jgi:L-ribulokinase